MDDDGDAKRVVDVEGTPTEPPGWHAGVHPMRLPFGVAGEVGTMHDPLLPTAESVRRL